jgi:hypothetical protein
MLDFGFRENDRQTFRPFGARKLNTGFYWHTVSIAG